MSDSRSEFKHVGKVMDAHGIRGDVYCLVFSGDVRWLDDLESLYFKPPLSKSTPKEYKIKRAKAFKRGFIVTLEGVADRNQAEALKGSELWLPNDLFVSEDGESIYLNEILQFKLNDQVLGEIGQITGFSSNTAQDLLLVETVNGVVEVPFVKEFVTEIDFAKQLVKTNLPEGLLEINNSDED